MGQFVSSIVASALILALHSTAFAEGLVHDRLGLGLHASGGGIGDDNSDGEGLDVGGGGLDVSYRVARHWDVELSLGGLGGENEELRRSFGIVTLGARFHFNPTGRWQWSLLGGLGSAEETLEILSPTGDVVISREFRHNLIYIGGALERRFGRIGVSLQLRAMGLERDDEDLDGPEFAGKDSPVPMESSGGEIRLGATYYF